MRGALQIDLYATQIRPGGRSSFDDLLEAALQVLPGVVSENVPNARTLELALGILEKAGGCVRHELDGVGLS